MIISIRMIVAAVFLCIGILLLLISAIGVLRLPDFISRLHSSGIGETLGMIMLGIGIIIYIGWNLVSVKMAFVVLALLLVNPVGTHLIGKAAHYNSSEKEEK